MVGISVFEPGALVAGRYRVVERLTRFAVTDQGISGVEFEYWLAVDEVLGAEVWLQAASGGGASADGAAVAGAVAAIRLLDHPAVPAVLDFGEVEIAAAAIELAEAEAEVEIEVEVIEDAIVEAEIMDAVADGYVRRIGFVVLAPVEGESLAALLLRGALAEVEILALLAEAAEVLELLHETELVHAHLSPYSIVLTETGLLFIDLAVALAVEAVADSELTIAADVYALAWLACVALIGFEEIEAEFGVGFAAAAFAGGLAVEGLSLELVARRRSWAEMNLVARYGMSVELAALLVAGLGEAAARPEVGMLTAAFRGLPVPAGHERALTAEAMVAGGVFVGAVANSGAIIEATAGSAQITEVATETTIDVEAETESGAGVGFATGAAAGVAAGAAAGAAIGFGAAAGMSIAEMGMAAPTAPAAPFSGAAAAESMAAHSASMAAAASLSATSETVTLPRISGGPGAPTAAYAASSAPYVSPSGPASPARRSTTRRRSGLPMLLGTGLAIVLVGALIWVLFGTNKKVTPVIATGSLSTTAAAAGVATTAASGLGAVVLPSVTAAAPSASSAVAASPSSVSAAVTSPTIPLGPPLATAPSSPQQALQQIQGLVNQSSSSLSPGLAGQLKGALATVQSELNSSTPVATGITGLRKILGQSGFPTGLAGQINQLIPFLKNVGGS